MPANRGRWAAWLGASALVLTGSPLSGSVARAATGPACAQVVTAPDFGASRTAFCASITSDGVTTSVTLGRSRDAGRTWQRATATGIVATAEDHLVQLVVSPAYSSDRALFVMLNGSGTFRSIDGGESFVPVDPQGFGAVAAARVLGGPPAPSATRGVLVVARHGAAEGANQSFVLDPPLPRLPVSGTPALDIAFVSAPDDRAVVLAVGATGAGHTYQESVFACAPTFSCATPLGHLPVGLHLDRIWLSPSFTKDGVVMVRAIAPDFRVVFLRSRDGGRTFGAWTSVQHLVDAVYAAGAVPQTDVSGVRVSGRGRLYFRIAAPEVSRGGTPAEQLFVSPDVGATWSRVAYGRSGLQSGPRGTMPVLAAPGIVAEPPGFVEAAGDRVFMAGAPGVFCSVDGGVHWSRSCSR